MSLSDVVKRKTSQFSDRAYISLVERLGHIDDIIICIGKGMREVCPSRVVGQ